jgi:IstB-like ATP binding protein
MVPLATVRRMAAAIPRPAPSRIPGSGRRVKPGEATAQRNCRENATGYPSAGCLRASLIVTSNKQSGRWGEVFDDVVADAMIACLVHHAEVIASRATATGSKTVT